MISAPTATANFSRGILSRINHGYDHLEPIVLGLMALEKSFMLIGRHGTGKTRLARILSRGHGTGSFAFFDATKDDLISIAGIPDVQAMNGGRLRFIAHERTIWNKTTVVVDEITRAGKESQNLWLEILEERTCFGLPLTYRSLIATANPDSYAAAFQLDEALLDRFHAVLPVPELQDDVTATDVVALVTLAQSVDLPSAEELAATFAEIRHAHTTLIAEGARERVVRYLAELVPQLLSMLARSDRRYISARTYARNLPEVILAVAAYYRAAGHDEPLRLGASEALRFAVATKLHISPAAVESLHRAVEALLVDRVVADSQRLRLEFSALDTFETRLAFVGTHWPALENAARPDELEKMLGILLADATTHGKRERLVPLREMLQTLGYSGEALRQVDSQLILVFRRAMAALSGRLAEFVKSADTSPRAHVARANVQWFLALDAQGSLFDNHTPGVVRLMRFLIDVFEHDLPTDPASLLPLFSELRLADAT